MASLASSLGLEKVESDPNAIPDGKYAGVVFKSEYVVVKKNNTVAHVITYSVTDGTHKGAQKTEWFKLGDDPVVDEKTGAVTSMTPTMTEQAKPWYKKRFVDLGIPEDKVATTDPKELVGKEVTFGVKKKDEFINVSFVELRGPKEATAPAEGQSDTGMAGLL